MAYEGNNKQLAYECLRILSSKANACLLPELICQFELNIFGKDKHKGVKIINVPRSGNIKKREVIIPSLKKWCQYNAASREIHRNLLPPYFSCHGESFEEHNVRWRLLKVELLRRAKELGATLLGVIDIERAFESVNRIRLFSRLREVGFDETATNILERIIGDWLPNGTGLPAIWLQKYSSLFDFYTQPIYIIFQRRYGERYLATSDNHFFLLQDEKDIEEIFLEFIDAADELGLRVRDVTIRNIRENIRKSGMISLSGGENAQQIIQRINEKEANKEYDAPELALNLLKENLQFTPESFCFLFKCLDSKVECHEGLNWKKELRAFCNNSYHRHYLRLWTDWLFSEQLENNMENQAGDT